jgi:hypothetical protein
MSDRKADEQQRRQEADDGKECWEEHKVEPRLASQPACLVTNEGYALARGGKG